MKLTKSQQGFTLIELLIVIAIIAILAIAVLAAINPFEQISRSRDTGSASDASEMLSATERYYVGNNEFPWIPADVPTGVDNDTAVIYGFVPGSFSGSADDNLDNIADELESAEEIKSVYSERVKAAGNLTVTKAANEGSPVFACYSPTSQQFRDQAVENCLNDTTGELPAFACGASSYAAGQDWVDEMICIN